ncbi:MAG: hypothetical protein M3Q48_09000, partial [Actinomycetota bacterium]|nr:hypothetical protein [Actinomycetota bacterium]
APGSFPLVAGLAVPLAGFWMTATHLPLLAQATCDGVGAGAAAYHAMAALGVAILGAVWAWAQLE